MFELSGAELVGYLASLLVVISLTMTSVVRLRMISLAGSLTFVVYGALIESAPIMLTNAAIALINVWFLRKEFAAGSGRGRDLGASAIRPDSPFLRDFVAFHIDDIHSFQPDFQMPSGDDVYTLMLTRDGLPAGFLVGRRNDDVLVIDLDYVLGPYRDSRIGQWLFGAGADVFRHAGIDTLRTTADTDTHRKYLERIGFSSAEISPDLLELEL